MISEEQRLARRNSIGGSDLAIILGLSKYKTPYQLYLEKRGEDQSFQEESAPQYWGNQLEPIIVAEFAKRNNITVETPDTVEHPLFSFLRGNLDGWIPEWNAVLEVKTSSSFMAVYWGEDGSDIIPMEYLVQVAFYCSLMNCETAYIAVLIGGNDYRQFKYNRDIHLEAKIIEAACEFWDSVQGDIPPPLSNHIDVKKMFPRHSPDKAKPITPDVLTHLSSLNQAKSQIKELEESEEKSRFEVMNYMQDAEFLINENDEIICTFKTNKKGNRSLLLKKI